MKVPCGTHLGKAVHRLVAEVNSRIRKDPMDEITNTSAQRKPSRGKRPHLVLFVAEDLDFEGLSCYPGSQTGYTGVLRAGNTRVRNQVPFDGQDTPHLDQLAAEGFRSENFWCVSAICTPSRYSMLTGRMPERSPRFREAYPDHRPANIFFNIGMTRDETNLAKVLKTAGYHTGMFGKWHNFPQDVKLRLMDMALQLDPDGDPREPGTKAALEALYETGREYLLDGFGWDEVDRFYHDNPEPFRPRAIASHNLEWIIEGALDFIDRAAKKEEPFFLYIPVTVPHARYRANVFKNDILATAKGMLDEAPVGMTPRAQLEARVRSRGLPDHAREGAWLDDAVGAVLGRLRQHGLDDETLFVFTTDHPTAGKESCHLGRIPLMMKWPGHVPAGVVSRDLISQVDLAPTLLEAAGVEIPVDMRTDGGSFLEHATHPERPHGRESLVLEVTHSRAVVAKGYKYIANRLPPHLAATADLARTGWFGSLVYDNTKFREKLHHHLDDLFPHYLERDHLYRLDEDPCEQRNLFGDPAHGGMRRELQDLLRQELGRLPHVFGEFRPSVSGQG